MENDYKKIAENLEKWWVLVHWTDTCFWFATFFDNEKWIKNIQKIKWRIENKPFSLLFSSIKQAKKYLKINEKQEIFMKENNLKTSFILEKKIILKNYFEKFNSISVRIENNNFLFKAVSVFKKPLTSTSVNISWEKNLNKKDDILALFWKNNFIDFIFNWKLSWESSNIWDLTWEKFIKLR